MSNISILFARSQKHVHRSANRGICAQREGSLGGGFLRSGLLPLMESCGDIIYLILETPLLRRSASNAAAARWREEHFEESAR